MDHKLLISHFVGMSLDEAEKELRRVLLMDAMRRHKGNQCRAADDLGIHRNTMTRSMDEADIPRRYGKTETMGSVVWQQLDRVGRERHAS